jgi:hypothetical protein
MAIYDPGALHTVSQWYDALTDRVPSAFYTILEPEPEESIAPVQSGVAAPEISRARQD